MSYTPTTWVNGDIITATKLNNIESGVQSVSSSYTPTTWVNGDIITATKLNNIEQGIANAGGGSSDFSTAEVTFINSSSYNISVSCPCIYTEDGENLALSEAYCEKSATTVIPCILYKGVCEISVSNSSPISTSISGDIEEIVAFKYSVTGNGTITIINF